MIGKKHDAKCVPDHKKSANYCKATFDKDKIGYVSANDANHEFASIEH